MNSTIFTVFTIFRVIVAEPENGQYNYLLKTLLPTEVDLATGYQGMRETFISYHSKEKYPEGSRVELRIKIECEQQWGIDETFNKAYRISICNAVEDK